MTVSCYNRGIQAWWGFTKHISFGVKGYHPIEIEYRTSQARKPLSLISLNLRSPDILQAAAVLGNCYGMQR